MIRGKKIILAVFLSVQISVAIVFLTSCDGGGGPVDPNGGGARTCSDVNWGQKGVVNFEVLYPNGGEVLYVGDTAKLTFCVNYASAMDPDDTPKIVSFDGGQSYHSIEHEFRNDTVYWVIPDSMTYVDLSTFTVVAFPTVSESCLFKVNSYDKTDPSVDFDISDASFSIRAR